MDRTKEHTKQLLEVVFKRIIKNSEVDVIYAELCSSYNQGKIDSLEAIKTALNIKECECR